MKISFIAPLSLLFAALCVVGTYIPLNFGLPGSLPAVLNPVGWIYLFTWPFIHADTTHLVSNMMLFLLLAPVLEHRYGAFKFLLCILFSSAAIGFAHILTNSATLIGASGIVFMCITMSTFLGGKNRIALHTIIVSCLFAYQELHAAFTTDNNISYLAHLGGGVLGILLGWLLASDSAQATSSEPVAATTSNKGTPAAPAQLDLPDFKSQLSPKARAILDKK